MQHIFYVLVPFIPLLQAPQTEEADVQVASPSNLNLASAPNPLPAERDWDAEYDAHCQESLGRYGY